MLKSCSIGFLLSVAIVLSAQKYSEFPVSFSKLDRYDSVMMINLYDSYAHYTENNNPDNHIESSYFLFFNPYNPDYPTEKLIVYQEMDELQNLSGNRTVNKYQRTIWILIAFALIFLIISFICFYRSNRKIKILANNLRSTVKELEIRNVNKDKLFSLISHDLIGPMGTIKSLIELYENQNYNKKDPEKIRLIIHNIGKEVKITYNLLENLLTWSKLQFGKIKYFPEDINLNAHVQENVNLYQKLAKDKHLTIKNSVPDNCIVFADKNLLDIIIRNLLSNAIKFTEKGKIIKVTADEENSFIRICVEDQGIGLNKTTLENLLKDDIYYSERGTGGERGSGLGLIMVKEFVKYHKGNLEIKSEPGKGSSFIFRLPAGQGKG